MADNISDDQRKEPSTNESSIPKFGLPIAIDKMSLMLCKPKLLPLQTYSYMRQQIQARNQLDRKQPTVKENMS